MISFAPLKIGRIFTNKFLITHSRKGKLKVLFFYHEMYESGRKSLDVTPFIKRIMALENCTEHEATNTFLGIWHGRY